MRRTPPPTLARLRLPAAHLHTALTPAMLAPATLPATLALTTTALLVITPISRTRIPAHPIALAWPGIVQLGLRPEDVDRLRTATRNETGDAEIAVTTWTLTLTVATTTATVGHW